MTQTKLEEIVCQAVSRSVRAGQISFTDKGLLKTLINEFHSKVLNTTE